jgi:hypothetical protein
MRPLSRFQRRSHRSRVARLAPPPPVWAPVAAVLATAVLVAAAKLTVGRRRDRGGIGGDGGSAYAPDPLTGDASSIEAADVAPV